MKNNKLHIERMEGFLFAAVMAAAISFSACEEEKEVKEPNLSTWDAGDIYMGERPVTEMPEGWEIVDGFHGTEQETESGVRSTASDSLRSAITAGDHSYYIYDGEDRCIYSVGAATAEVRELYHVPEHQNESAYEGDLWNPRVQVQLYDGSLYFMAFDEAEYKDDETAARSPAKVFLYRLNEGEPEKVQCLAETDAYEDERSECCFFIYRGYVYYWYELSTRITNYDTWRNGNNCIWRAPIGGTVDERECIYAWQNNAARAGSNADIMMLVPYGDYLYFADASEGIKYLYRVYISGQCLERIRLEEEGEVKQIFTCDDSVYYQVIQDQYDESTETLQRWSELKQVSLSDGNVTLCLSLSGYSSILYDGGLWYVNRQNSGEKSVTVYDVDFKEISRIDDMIFQAWGGRDPETVLVETDDGSLAVADKKDILTGNPALKELKEITWETWLYSEWEDLYNEMEDMRTTGLQGESETSENRFGE